MAPSRYSSTNHTVSYVLIGLYTYTPIVMNAKQALTSKQDAQRRKNDDYRAYHPAGVLPQARIVEASTSQGMQSATKESGEDITLGDVGIDV